MPLPTLRERFGFVAKALAGVLAPDRVYGMLQAIQPGGRGDPPRRGTAGFLEAYTTMPWLRAVTERVADQVAGTHWRLYANKRAGGKARKDMQWARAPQHIRKTIMKSRMETGDLTEIVSHPLLDALRAGNQLLVGGQVSKMSQTNRDLVGESFEIKERNAFGIPVALWNIPASWVVELPTPANPAFRVSFRSWNGLIPMTEILWQSNPNPANPYGRGTGIAQTLGDELETDEFAAKFMRHRFYNQARPDLIVYGDGLTKSNTEKLEEAWTAKARGFWQTAKPFFVNQKIDVKEIGQTNVELDLSQLRKDERDIIVHVFGFPPEIFGILENSNRSTIDSADYLMAKHVVLPRVEARREFLQARLVPDYDDRIILDYDSPVAEDKEFELKVMQAFPWSFDVDAQRDLGGHPPLPNKEGKVFMAPFQYIPVKTPGAALTPGEAWAQDGGGGAPAGAPNERDNAA